MAIASNDARDAKTSEIRSLSASIKSNLEDETVSRRNVICRNIQEGLNVTRLHQIGRIGKSFQDHIS